MDTLTLDFETYYDKDYSLSKITTQQYILDQRFEVIGVSVKINDDMPEWFSGTMKETAAWLAKFDWENSMAIAHNMLFDGAILAWRFGVHPKYMFCTMMGSRPFLVPFIPGGRMSLAKVSEHLGIGKKGTEVVKALGKRLIDFGDYELNNYAGYCIQDSNLCYKIAKHLIPKFPKEELKLLHLNLRKYTQPMLELDYDVLESELARIRLEKLGVLRRAGLDGPEILMSNEKFAAALKLLGINPPRKISPRTGKETWAFAKTDPGMIALTEHPRTDIQALAAARLKSKSTLDETRIVRLMAVHQTGRSFGIPLLYYGAHTGRLSGYDKLNQQNNTKGSAVRRSIIAPPGHKVVAGDLSQIECRVLAVLAGQTDLVRAFADGEDVYCKTAFSLYGREITKADVNERFIGKTATLGCGYGVGWSKFHKTVTANPEITITESEAQRIVTAYRNTYPKIPKLWKLANEWLEHMCSGSKVHLVYKGLRIYANYNNQGPAIVLPNGMPMYYPELYKDAGKEYWYTKKGKVTKVYGASVVENICQALARIIISAAELKLATVNYFAANQVHDELVYVVPDNKVSRFCHALELVLRSKVPWMPELPVDCEIHSGDNYAECK